MNSTKLARSHGVRYLFVEKLFGEWVKAPLGLKTTAKVVTEPGGFLTELAVNAIYGQTVIFAKPNDKGGLTFIRLTWEQIEFPRYSFAARAVAANDAQRLYPIDEKMNEKKKAKQKALQEVYIENHWQDFYDTIVAGMRAHDERQAATPAIDWQRQWVLSIGELSKQLISRV